MRRNITAVTSDFPFLLHLKLYITLVIKQKSTTNQMSLHLLSNAATKISSKFKWWCECVVSALTYFLFDTLEKNPNNFLIRFFLICFPVKKGDMNIYFLNASKQSSCERFIHPYASFFYFVNNLKGAYRVCM